MVPDSLAAKHSIVMRAFVIAIAYGIVSVLWIAFSDKAVLLLVPEGTAELITRYQTAKGWGFVAVTTGLLYVLVHHSLRAIQRADQAGRLAEAQILGLVEVAPLAVFVHRKDRLVSANATAAALVGASREDELIGRDPSTFLSHEGKARYEKLVSEYVTKGLTSPVVEERLHRLDGSTIDVRMVVAPTEFNGLRAVQTVVHDLSAVRKQEEMLAKAATHDALTGLPNVTMLTDRVAQAIIHAKRFNRVVAVLIFDIDDFRRVTDRFGYDGGDQVLRELAGRLESSVRPGDTVARISGDQFAVAFTDVRDANDATSIAEALFAAAAAPIRFRGDLVGFSITGGIAMYPDAGSEGQTLIGNADAALYRAKAAARGSLGHHSESAAATARERARIAAALREAVERNEFVLHYQPQVLAADGSIVGCEALLRWTSPSLGAVSPGKFIPVAEESELIEKIGVWVLHEACRQAKRWRDAGLRAIVVSLNVSARQLQNDRLPEAIRRALHDTQADPGSIEVELTESTIMQDVERMVERVQRMRELGIRLAIDDFGTGYSNLAHLGRFPADRLKVDQSFVRNIAKTDIAAIVQTVIALGRALKLSVIAEGVETRREAGILKDWGCDELQGYFFGRPMPADALAAELTKTIGGARL